MSADSYVFHIVRRDAWLEALERGNYAPPSLYDEGFIHCSTAVQVAATANRWFSGQADLLLLRIDTRLLSADLKYEAPIDGGPDGRQERFPHLYGALNLEAVVEVNDFPLNGNRELK